MWIIQEQRRVAKACTKAPPEVVRKYELWKRLVFRHGPQKLREFGGFADEALRGPRRGQRSSRLNQQYRVIYQVDRDIVTVFVLEITPHKY